MQITEITLDVDNGGRSSNIVVAAAGTAQSPVVVTPANHPAGIPVPCIFTADATMFVRKGTNPTAVTDGTDILVLANNTYRTQLLPGERLSFASVPGGNVKFTPFA